MISRNSYGADRVLRRQSSSVSRRRGSHRSTQLVDHESIEWNPANHPKVTLVSNCVSLQCFAIFSCFMSILMFCGAAFSLTLFHNIVREEIYKSLKFDSPEAEGFKYFESTMSNVSEEILMNVYVQDIQNARDVIQGKAKPCIKEVGPFVYQIDDERFNVTWSQENEIVNFKNWNRFIFRKDKSVFDEKEYFMTTPNVELLGMYYVLVRHLPGWMQAKALSMTFGSVDDSLLFQSVSVHTTSCLEVVMWRSRPMKVIQKK